jgi:hypothetical protein
MHRGGYINFAGSIDPVNLWAVMPAYRNISAQPLP